MRAEERGLRKAQKTSEMVAEEAGSEQIEAEEADGTREELARLKKELEAKTAQADEYLNRLKYLQADFENYKKMVARERELYETCATEALIKRLLPILDHLEAAFTSAQSCKDLVSFVKGIELIYLDFLEALSREGVKPIKAVGEKYDPYKHEVLMTVIDEDAPEDTVLEELERGYMLGTKVLRSAKVAISRHASENEENAAVEAS
ncbi:MAG: nucleotide exchange factor GrpE [Candidatus Methanospirareceae archaeon]